MNWIEAIAIVTLIILIFISAYLVVKSIKTKKDSDESLSIIEIKKQSLPIVLQANERITLMLERISPKNLIFRINHAGLSVNEIHQLLLDDIRQEFYHNVTQQIYFTDTTWKHVQLAKEEVVSLINEVALTMDDNSTAQVFFTNIFDKINTTGLPNMDIAKQMIKKDVKKLTHL